MIIWFGEKSNFLSLTEFFRRAENLLFHWLETQHLWEFPGSREGPGEAEDGDLGVDFSHPFVQPEQGAGFARQSVNSSEAEAANMKINLEQLIWTINFQSSWQ